MAFDLIVRLLKINILANINLTINSSLTKFKTTFESYNHNLLTTDIKHDGQVMVSQVDSVFIYTSCNLFIKSKLKITTVNSSLHKQS